VIEARKVSGDRRRAPHMRSSRPWSRHASATELLLQPIASWLPGPALPAKPRAAA
jgi:hypothetical protein